MWERLRKEELLYRLGKADEIDWERASLDSAAVPAPGGPKDRPEPDGQGQIGLEAPCCGRLKGRPARGDSHRRQRPRLQGARRGRGRRPADPQARRPRKRPKRLHADKGYDFPRCHKAFRKRGITPRIARRGIESSEKLGRHRWVVERTLSWLNRYRRLKVRYERRTDIHQAFLDLGCALICWRYVQRFC